MGWVSELRRRNVIKVAVAYAVVTWLLIQVAETTFPILKLPEWSVTFVTAVLLIGFPVALIFAWAFELTPEGIKLEKHVDRSQSITHLTGRKFDYVIIAVLALALAFFAFDKFVLDPSRDAELVQSTTEALIEQAVEASKAESVDRSIAVLPFVNMSDDPGDEYFSDGISEEIINLLVKVPELRVISRSSAFSFKGQGVDIPTMAAKLNVSHILEGSVRKSGNQLRITAQLIYVADDTHLWSETYERELKSVFAIQDEIAAAVVDALKITLMGHKPKSAETDSEAYILYLQARHSYGRQTKEDLEKSESLLEQVLDIDSSFAPAWTLLGAVYRWQTSLLLLRPVDEGNELARHAIQQALAIDPKYGEAYAILAEIESIYDRDYVTALQHLQQALALDPNNDLVLTTAARLNGRLGRFEKAIDFAQRVINRNPLSGNGYWQLAANYQRANRLVEASNTFRTMQSLGVYASHYGLGLVLLAQGNPQAALAQMEQETDEYSRLQGMAVVTYALGDITASDTALQMLIDKWGASVDYQVAEIYAFRGENDLAFDKLEQAYENRDAGLSSLLVDSLFENLHDDPRWEPFLEKMGFPD